MQKKNKIYKFRFVFGGTDVRLHAGCRPWRRRIYQKSLFSIREFFAATDERDHLNTECCNRTCRHNYTSGGQTGFHRISPANTLCNSCYYFGELLWKNRAIKNKQKNDKYNYYLYFFVHYHRIVIPTL